MCTFKKGTSFVEFQDPFGAIQHMERQFLTIMLNAYYPSGARQKTLAKFTRWDAGIPAEGASARAQMAGADSLHCGS